MVYAENELVHMHIHCIIHVYASPLVSPILSLHLKPVYVCMYTSHSLGSRPPPFRARFNYA